MINKSLLHPNDSRPITNLPILPRRLPVPHLRRTVRLGPVRVFVIEHTEEVPLQVSALQLRLTWKIPRLGFVHVGDGDRVELKGFVADLAF